MTAFWGTGKLRLIAVLIVSVQVASACSSTSATTAPAGATVAPGNTTTASGAAEWQAILQAKTITWGVANEPPLTVWPSDTDKVTGQGPEEIRVIFAALGITNFKSVRLEFSGLIPGLQAKRFDVVANGLTIRPDRCSQVAFSNPFLIGQQGLTVKKGNPLNIHSMKDIAANPNLKVGVLQGAIEIDYLHSAGVPDNQVLKFPDNASVFAALHADRIDAIEMEAAPMRYQLAGLNDPNMEEVTPYAQPLDASGKPVIAYQAVAFRKDDTAMRDAFNVALAGALTSGALLKAAEPFYITQANMPPADVKTADLCPGGN